MCCELTKVNSSIGLKPDVGVKLKLLFKTTSSLKLKFKQKIKLPIGSLIYISPPHKDTHSM